MAIDVDAAEEAVRDDLVDRLRAHGIRYIGGGSDWRGDKSPYALPAEAPVPRLVGDLVASGDTRLQTAAVALLLRHPEYAGDALTTANTLAGRSRLLVEASILAAAALQSTWAFSLDLCMPGWSRIDADALAARFNLPTPREDYGRATLDALDDLLNRDVPFHADRVGAWQDVGRHVLDGLREEALAHVET